MDLTPTLSRKKTNIGGARALHQTSSMLLSPAFTSLQTSTPGPPVGTTVLELLHPRMEENDAHTSSNLVHLVVHQLLVNSMVMELLEELPSLCMVLLLGLNMNFITLSLSLLFFLCSLHLDSCLGNHIHYHPVYHYQSVMG